MKTRTVTELKAEFFDEIFDSSRAHYQAHMSLEQFKNALEGYRSAWECEDRPIFYARPAARTVVKLFAEYEIERTERQ
ncbi:hypothetical protein LNV09_24010 [Paucibacter sp. B2R-40]|uniref:hypothetical protein n=1 Tax=Paucibacter sp. B2R-40 TaxID=2893554 RepID=UPI0021E35E78|nr:hypothetical protein [Paucibacter sp. B2R-40]MCV2357222.1 hypothetical protein [Paucibacter sp. B2R-40]